MIEVVHSQQLLHPAHTVFGEYGGAALFVDGIVTISLELGDDGVGLVVDLGGFLGRAADDQGSAGLVDEDGVHLVDDGEVMFALRVVVEGKFHVVAQVVEAEFGVVAVGDVGPVGLLPFQVRQAVDDYSHAHPQPAIEPAHPLGVTLGQVFVYSDHVHAATGQGVQVHRQGSHQGLALTGLHLGDLALMQHDTAQQLHVVVPLAEHANGRLAHYRESFRQQFVQYLVFSENTGLLVDVAAPAQLPLHFLAEALAEFRSLALELLVGQGAGGWFQGVYLLQQGAQFLQAALVAGTKEDSRYSVRYGQFIILHLPGDGWPRPARCAV